MSVAVPELKGQSHAGDSLGTVEQLLRRCSELQQRAIADSRRRAPNNNLFSLLGLERSEVGTHSPFLKDLLDPYGTHAQGGLFLRGFLRVLADHDPRLRDLADEVDDAPRPGEWQVRLEHRRIDFSIWSHPHSVLVFVENKIDALEAPDQLTRYRHLLERQSGAYTRRLLVFLAPEKYGRPTSGPADIVLTYERDVHDWIGNALADVKATRTRANLEQYLEIISRLNTEDSAMPHIDGLVELLASSENIWTTLQIGDAVADVKLLLRRRFWEAVDRKMRDGLRDAGLDRQWTIEDPDGVIGRKWDGLMAVARPENERPRLMVGVWQERSALFYGVGFDKKPQQPPHLLKEIRELRTSLENELTKGPDEWFVAWEWADVDLEATDVLSELASNASLLAERISERVLELLRKNGARIAAADTALDQGMAADVAT